MLPPACAQAYQHTHTGTHKQANKWVTECLTVSQNLATLEGTGGTLKTNLKEECSGGRVRRGSISTWLKGLSGCVGATRGKATQLCFLVTSENTTPATMDTDLDLESRRANHAVMVGEGGFNAAGRCCLRHKHLHSSIPRNPPCTDTAQDTLC